MARANRSSWMLGVWLVVACGPSATRDGDGDGGSGGADTSASDPSADPTMGAGALTHGTVELTMQHRECLTSQACAIGVRIAATE